MCIKELRGGVILKLRVKTNAKTFSLKPGFIEVTSPPKEGKANIEIVKALKALFGREVEILGGKKSRDKLIFIRGATEKEARLILCQKTS